MALGKDLEAEIEITGITHDGDGVGRLEDMVVFVPGCAQGDRALIKIASVKRHYARGRLLEVLRPSPGRIQADCPVFYKCGGCAFRHLTYQEELRIKWQRVKDAFSRIGHIAIEPEPIVGSPLINGYRNKARCQVAMSEGRPRIGFYAGKSHSVVEYGACLLQPAVFAAAAEAFRKWITRAGVSVYDQASGKGLLRHIVLRQAEATGEVMACVVINGGSLPQPELLVGLLRSAVPQTASVVCIVSRGNSILGDKAVTIWGKARISDILGGLRLEISPLSFYQVNHRQSERLYQAAEAFAGLQGGELLVDLYCGTGAIGLYMAKKAGRVTGVEVVEQAVEDARRNAALNGILNAEFICADAAQAAGRLLNEGLRPDVVVCDPPRKGLSVDAVEAISRMAPRKIVYVSCDPATLARDVALFAKRGYRCSRLKPFDMFPRTAHVECVTLMSRVEK